MGWDVATNLTQRWGNFMLTGSYSMNKEEQRDDEISQ